MNVSDVCIVLLYRDRTERERESLCSIVDRVMKEVNNRERHVVKQPLLNLLFKSVQRQRGPVPIFLSLKYSLKCTLKCDTTEMFQKEFIVGGQVGCVLVRYDCLFLFNQAHLSSLRYWSARPTVCGLFTILYSSPMAPFPGMPNPISSDQCVWYHPIMVRRH